MVLPTNNAQFSFASMPDAVIEVFCKKLTHVDFMSFMTVSKAQYERLKNIPSLKGRLDTIKFYKIHLNQAFKALQEIEDEDEKNEALNNLLTTHNEGGILRTPDESRIEAVSMNVLSLIRVAKELAASSQKQEAITVFNDAKKEAKQIDDKFEKILNLITIAKAQVQVNYKQESEYTFALAIQKTNEVNPVLRDRSLEAISTAQLSLGKSLDAIQTVNLIETPEERAKLLAEIGKVQAKVGMVNEANETFQQAVETVPTILSHCDRSEVLAAIGSAQLETNHIESAYKTIRTANHFANGIQCVTMQVKALSSICEKLARVR